MERLLYEVCSVNILYVSSSITFWKWQNYRHSKKICGYQEFGGKKRWIGGTWGIFQFSCSVMSDSLWTNGLQHARLPCPSPTPRACSKSYSSSPWCHPTISSSVVPFFSRLQSFPASRVFSNESASHEVAKVLELQLQHQSFQWTSRTDFLQDWLVWSCSPRDSQESFPKPQFKNINSSVLSFLYSPTLTSIHDYWENHSFD